MHTSKHKQSTVHANILEGSRRKQLRATGTICDCGKKGQRLHSARDSSWVVACVDAKHPNQVRNLACVADEMNARREQGMSANEHDVNDAWYAIARGERKGKGRKHWSKPISRWRKVMRGDF